MTGRRETERQRVIRALEQAGLAPGAGLGLPAARPDEYPWGAELSLDRTELRIFEDTSALRRPKSRRPQQLLNSFIGIESPEDVVSFIHAWGPLRLCRTHGVRHCAACPAGGFQLDIESEGFAFIESVRGYMLHSRLARYVLRLIANTESREPVAEDADPDLLDWAMRASAVSNRYHSLAGALSIPRFTGRPDWTYFARFALAESVNAWLRLGDVTPIVEKTWDWLIRGGPAKVVLNHDAFGAIGLELLASLAGGEVAICSLCGRPYHRRVSPTRMRKNYCPECRGKPADAARQRDSRARKARRRAAKAASAATESPS